MASSQFSTGASPWALLDEFASIGHRRNATTATATTSAGGTVEVSFDLVAPPAISRWFVHFSSLRECEYKRKPHILNAAAAGGGGGSQLVLMRMAVFSVDGGRAVDYFVYNSGHGTRKPSLDLIPGPYPEIYFPKQIGVLPSGGGGEHYAVVFPAARFEARAAYDLHVYSSATRAWSTKAARVAVDEETGWHDVARHDASKAVPAGGGHLAWIDLWRGVLLCNPLDDDPELRLLQWPVPPPGDDDMCIEMYSAGSIRDATVSFDDDDNGDAVVRFVEVSFDFDDGGDGDGGYEVRGWTATAWKREACSEYWFRCFEVDVAGVVAGDEWFSDLTCRIWDDEVNREGLSKVFSAPPTLSLSSEDVVYLMTKFRTTEDSGYYLLMAERRSWKTSKWSLTS